MTQVYVKYNPYRLKTEIQVNGKDLPQDSGIYKLLKGKRLQEWVGNFPRMLVDEFNSVDFDVDFCGMPLDWDDFQEAMNAAKRHGTIHDLHLRFIEGKASDDVTDKIVSIFNDLKEGPMDDFRDPRLLAAFENIRSAVFPINVIATMSSGKSTLVNALLQRKLMPSKNEACTATITEILDTDEAKYTAVVFDTNGGKMESIDDLTYEVMDHLNSNTDVGRIKVKGNIPFLDSNTMALCLIDTPGPNNAQNQEHKNTTYSAINADSNNLILYVLNATQLGTNDDANLLNYVAEQIRKGGKQARDRFLFVINKMDAFNPEEENIEGAVERAKKYLAEHGIEEPQIFPCSAQMALVIRTLLKDVDLGKLTISEMLSLPTAASEMLPKLDKFIKYPALHLEQYSTLSPSAQQELNFRLKQAEARNDTKEQALIHSGICSIESAITAYVKKYAKTKKVKDLVESFQEVLESNQVLVNAKMKIATSKKAAEECAQRAAVVREKIANGKEAEEFKDRVKKLDPMPTIIERTEKMKVKAIGKINRIFVNYGDSDTINSREEAERLVNLFVKEGSDEMAELSADIESLINHEIVEVGRKLLEGYQKKLISIDDTADVEELDFSTIDLVKGALSNMMETTTAHFTDQFVAGTIDDYGEVTVEEKEYYEKVGQKEEKVVVGSHQEKAGTQKIKVGSHQEKIGTRKVKNPNRKFFFSFKPKYIDEDVYETVDDYKEIDVYKSVLDYKTVMKDIFEKKTEKIEKYSVEVSDLQAGLISDYRLRLDNGIENAKKYADDQIKEFKKQFEEMFDKLDALIQSKYEELNRTSEDQQDKEAELENNRKRLKWIETCKMEIDEALDM